MLLSVMGFSKAASFFSIEGQRVPAAPGAQRGQQRFVVPAESVLNSFSLSTT